MTRTLQLFLAIIALFVFTAGTCERLPDPEIPDDTPDCEAAGANLLALGCEEATLPDGHALNPSCLKSIKGCDEISTVCGQ